MAARRLWLIFATELGVYALSIAVVHRELGVRVSLLACAVPIVMLGVRLTIVLATFVIAACVRRGPPLSPLAWMRMIAAESAAFMRFQFLIALHPRNDDAHTEPDRDTPLVVLLHGIYCNGAVWRPIVEELHARTGCTIRTPDLQPTVASLDVQALAFDEWLQTAAASNPTRPIIVVAHSLGGLVVRRYLLERPRLALDLICIGTPHRGTVIAKALRTPIGRDLRQEGAALAQLIRAPLPHEMLNVYTLHDNLVVPAAASELEGARNRTVIGCGHLALIYSPEIKALLCAEIDRVLHRARASAIAT